MRILCDQMVKESFVTTLEAEDRHTVARVRDFLTPDADDIPHGLLFYEDDPAPTPGVVRDAVREIDRVYDDSAAIVEWVPDGWV